MASVDNDNIYFYIVKLPDNPPTISVGRDPLDYGDMLRANCSSPPARPPALLKFLLNNLTVARSEPLTPRKTMEQAWSDLTLEMELYEFHFSQGRLILKCVSGCFVTQKSWINKTGLFKYSCRVTRRDAALLNAALAGIIDLKLQKDE
ncbi:unnamed protein product [Brassicogethes aeneus]|uniref:Uncharacterized protein n=1 Tax=Brassicogethes aeneus TaxID=1431903 RepID=A0A9P0FJ87_BRAAE|nr:unnamed protein product [Brassicogethes aeneus]